MNRWCVLLLLPLAACQGRDAAPRSAQPPSPAERLAPDVRLGSFDLSAERGKVVLVFFGYTRCPDVCPMTLADFAGVRRRLSDRANRVKFVFVSVDPRDTEGDAARYARNFDRSFIGLAGDSATIAGVQRSFRVASYLERDSSGQIGGVAHSASIFIVGPDGKMEETLRFGDANVDNLYAKVDEALKKPVPAALRVADPWVRIQGDITSMSAGYLTIENPGAEPATVRGVSCDSVRMVTIHESREENGVMRMVPRDSLVVPAGGSVELKPGGIHLMLMGLGRALNAGATLGCRLETSAGAVRLAAAVRGS